MVKQIKKKDKEYFACELCNMVYLDKKLAEKCEDFCKKYKSCNLDIVKKAVKLK
jgi:hypothetical protein